MGGLLLLVVLLKDYTAPPSVSFLGLLWRVAFLHIPVLVLVLVLGRAVWTAAVAVCCCAGVAGGKQAGRPAGVATTVPRACMYVRGSALNSCFFADERKEQQQPRHGSSPRGCQREQTAVTVPRGLDAVTI